MNSQASTSFANGFLILLFAAQAAPGSEIFHWVDEDGVATFSDWAPANSSVEVSKMVITESNPADYDPAEDPNSILVQAERTNERWEELKEQKEERREQYAETATEQRYPVPADFYAPYYAASPYFFRTVRPPEFIQPRPFKTQKRQLVALDRLGLLGGARPHSINSSAHLARVNASQAFKTSLRHHRPARIHHEPALNEW